MTTVNVYIVSVSKPDQPGGISPQAKRLYELFASPLFQTTILKLEEPEKCLKEYTGFNKEASSEIYRFNYAMKLGLESKNPVLFITDTSVTDADAVTIDAIVTSLLANPWDICYLSKWLDSCDLYGEKKMINKNGTVLVNAVNPHGIQAIMVRPDRFSIDASCGELALKDGTKIDYQNNLSTSLQKLIADKKIVATTVSPNLFSVDPATIEKKEDYVKLNECRDPMRDETINIDVNKTGVSTWVWIVLGLLVLIILFLAYKLKSQ